MHAGVFFALLSRDGVAQCVMSFLCIARPACFTASVTFGARCVAVIGYTTHCGSLHYAHWEDFVQGDCCCCCCSSSSSSRGL